LVLINFHGVMIELERPGFVFERHGFVFLDAVAAAGLGAGHCRSLIVAAFAFVVVVVGINDGGRLVSESMSGDLVLRLPAKQQAEFEVQTYSGDIRSDFGESVRVSRGPGSVLKYKEGNNGALIRLESFSGDIHIRRQ
jgi:hypothetical protein